MAHIHNYKFEITICTAEGHAVDPEKDKVGFIKQKNAERTESAGSLTHRLLLLRTRSRLRVEGGATNGVKLSQNSFVN